MEVGQEAMQFAPKMGVERARSWPQPLGLGSRKPLASVLYTSKRTTAGLVVSLATSC